MAERCETCHLPKKPEHDCLKAVMRRLVLLVDNVGVVSHCRACQQQTRLVTNLRGNKIHYDPFGFPHNEVCEKAAEYYDAQRAKRQGAKEAVRK